VGDWADDMEAKAQLYESQIEDIQEKINENAAHGIWETRHGKRIKFSKMKKSHKRNIIKYFKENYGDYILLPDEIYWERESEICSNS
jgi:hypothetical protein